MKRIKDLSYWGKRLCNALGGAGWKNRDCLNDDMALGKARVIWELPPTILSCEEAVKFYLVNRTNEPHRFFRKENHKFRKKQKELKRITKENEKAYKILQRNKIEDFYKSWEWKKLSYEAKLKMGRRCMCCGATPERGAVIHTDHIKPIRTHWELRLDFSNLQILCEDCNKGKASSDTTDWRNIETSDETVIKLDQFRG